MVPAAVVSVLAKKFDIEKAANGETIPCPYCGKNGVLVSRLQGGWIIAHKHGWVERPGREGGTIPCEVLLDGCRASGKFGENFPVAQEDEFVLPTEEEEFTL